jgi:hypothetical protein
VGILNFSFFPFCLREYQKLFKFSSEDELDEDEGLGSYRAHEDEGLEEYRAHGDEGLEEYRAHEDEGLDVYKARLQDDLLGC